MDQVVRSKLNRKPDRGSNGNEDIYPILDATFLCHVAFVLDGEARVLPTAFVRLGDAIYLHGHLRNQMLNTLLNGQVVCVTVTLLDGLVLARSGFHHSVNYRSAVVYGQAEAVAAQDKNTVLNALIDHMVPGRSGAIREATEQELNATLVIKIPIREASAKSRRGPPIDAGADLELDVWAGVVNQQTIVSGIDDCPQLKAGIERPPHVLALK